MPQEFVFVFFEMFLVYLPNKVKDQRICSSKGALLTFMIIGVGNQFPFSCLQSLDLSVFQSVRLPSGQPGHVRLRSLDLGI